MHICLITGYRVQYGHNVSHANNKTNRVFLPNLHSKYLFSERLGKIKVHISTRGIRTVDKYGGIDEFLLKAKNRKLTDEAKQLRKQLAQFATTDKYVFETLNQKSKKLLKKVTKNSN